MKRNNIFAVLALSFFMAPVAGAMSHPATAPNWLGVEVADAIVRSIDVQAVEASDSTMNALEPQKRILTDGKKYGTVTGVVSYNKGEAIVNAKLEFVSEPDTILTTSQADGAFSIELLEGEYDLYVSYQEEKIKPVSVKVKAGKTTEISKNKLEFDSKHLKELEVLGAKGKRYVLPNAEVMIHQPSGGAKGQATDIKIVADHILRTKAKLNKILAENTGKPVEEVARDTERDNFMTAEEAKAYGLIDEVITRPQTKEK